MTDKMVCEHCGAKIVEYKHGLSKGLMRVLHKIIKECNGESREFEFKNVGLNYNQASNFQKLRYWDLIEKVGDSDGHGGDWRLTVQGLSFAKGYMTLPKFAKTYRGDVVSHEGEQVRIGDVTDGWTYRSEYATDATPHDIV